MKPAAAWCLTVLFLLAIFSVPLVQVAMELHRGQRPTVLALFNRLPTREHLRTFEETLETTSAPRTTVQPYLQLAATQWGGFGNTKVVLGRDGWLFYSPGVELVTGRGILDPNRLRQRVKDRVNAGEPDFHPDPRPAIRQFAETCRQHGATLLLMPVPDKAMLQPAELDGRADPGDPAPPPRNPDHAKFLAEMEAQGIEILDLTPPLIAPGEVRFLVQDTHWTPEWMDAAAQSLARRLQGRLSSASTTAELALQPQSVSRLGDLVDMLRLPSWQRVFLPQTVTVQGVVDRRTRLPWQARADADVLLLGDSFANVYSLEVMGWGDAAGLVEHLAFHLGRPVDRIVRNDHGAWATRQALAEEYARGKDRLKGKKVVVWEFAARELMVGNWKPMTIELGHPPPSRFVVPAAGQPARVTARLEAIARAPRPGTVPYKDHIVALHISEIESDNARINGGQAVVYAWSMRNNVWTDAARWLPGRRVALVLRPWAEVQGKLDAVNRAELPDDALMYEEPCWAEELVEP